VVYAFQEAEKEVVIDEKVNNVPLEERAVNHEPLLYADKLVCIL
jgi:pre-mRNA-processing factor 40